VFRFQFQCSGTRLEDAISGGEISHQKPSRDLSGPDAPRSHSARTGLRADSNLVDPIQAVSCVRDNARIGSGTHRRYCTTRAVPRADRFDRCRVPSAIKIDVPPGWHSQLQPVVGC